MKKLSFALMFIFATSHNVLADHDDEQDDSHYDYAHVISAEPVYQQITRRIPREECRLETVRYDRPNHEPRSMTGTLVGAMVGAAIGNQIGRDKKGRRIGRAAGAVLGASVGHDASRRQSGSYTTAEYAQEEYCSTHYETITEEQPAGYDVTYRYHGKLYHTRMNRHPGRKIQVKVDVRPVY